MENWDGESKDNSKATFTFTPRPRPLPEGTFEDDLADAEVRENEEETTAVDSTDAPDILSSDVLPESNDDDGEGNPPAAGAGQPL